MSQNTLYKEFKNLIKEISVEVIDTDVYDKLEDLETELNSNIKILAEENINLKEITTSQSVNFSQEMINLRSWQKQFTTRSDANTIKVNNNILTLKKICEQLNRRIELEHKYSRKINKIFYKRNKLIHKTMLIFFIILIILNVTLYFVPSIMYIITKFGLF